MVQAQKVTRELSTVSRTTAANRFKIEMECKCEGRCRLACRPERYAQVPVAEQEAVRSLSEHLNNQIQKAADKDQEAMGSAGAAALSNPNPNPNRNPNPNPNPNRNPDDFAYRNETCLQ